MSSSTYAPRRRATVRTWIGFGAALAALLVMVALGAAVGQISSPGAGAAAGAGAGALGSPGGTGALGAREGSGSDQDGAGSQDGESDSEPGSVPGTASQPGPDQQGAEPGNGGQSGEGSDGPDDHAEPDPVGPQIEVFEVVQQPVCPGGTVDFPVEGQPVSLEWKVTDTDSGQVSLSIDGPGVYNHYPAEGGDTIHFPCEGAEGDVQEHTYLLTAESGGVVATQTLVVSATVQEVTDN